MPADSFYATITFTFSESDVSNLGLRETDLLVFRLDGVWQPLEAILDTVDNSATVPAAGLGRFMIGSFEPSGVEDSHQREGSPLCLEFQVWPNPLRSRAALQYGLAEECHVSIEVFNLLGRVIVTLVNERQPAGHRTVDWDSRDRHGDNVAVGIYFVRLEAAGSGETEKVVILHQSLRPEWGQIKAEFGE